MGPDNEKLLNDEKITMVYSQYKIFCMYINETALSELAVMAIRLETWNNVDIKMFKVDVFWPLPQKNKLWQA